MKNRSLYSGILVLVALSLTSISSAHNEKGKMTIADHKTDLLVSSQWLSEHLNDPGLVVLDTSVIVKMDEKDGYRSLSGRPQYEKEHIPTAVFADLMGNLSGVDGNKDFIMPPPQDFANAIGDLGVSNNSHVVIYSADNHAWSARLWWMLRWAGLEKISILDGGMDAWKAEGRKISSQAVTPKKVEFKLNLNPQLIADRNEVLAAITDKQVTIVDALSPGHYQGKFGFYSRKGHIKSAINLPNSTLTDENGRFKSFDELEMMNDGNRNQRTITYCGGGVAASLAAFNLYRIGFKDVSVYMGSLQEWTENPENPMSTVGLE
jgi:thiosulfate/3-mercaptopyruvate sulfurtransferase